MKIVKFLEKSGLLIKGVSETIENKEKEQNGGFVSILLGTLAANFLGSTLASKEVIWTVKELSEKTKLQRKP